MKRWLLLSLCACHATVAIERPPSDPSSRSAIIAFEEEDRLQVMALNEPDPLAGPFAARDGSTITVLYLPYDLATLHIVPGVLPAVEIGARRRIPDFSTAYRLELSGGSWTQIDALPEALAQFRFVGLTLEECAAKGGCYPDSEHAELEDCNLPCIVAEPAPPEVMEMLPRLPCGPGTYQPIDATECEPVGGACPAGDFAGDLPPGAILVNAGGDLAAAIAGAPEGATIGLSKGTHASGAIDRPIRIVGACSETILSAGDVIGEVEIERATLTGNVVVRAGSLALRGVFADGPSIRADAPLAIDRSRLASAPISAYADLTIERSAIDGRGLILRDRSTIRDTIFERVDGPAIFASSASGTIEGVRITDDADPGMAEGDLCSIECLGESDLSIRRLAMSDLFREGLCMTDECRLTVSDFTATNIGDRGTLLVGNSKLTLDRAVIDGAGEGLVAFLYSAVDARDVVLTNLHGNIRYVSPTVLGYPRGRGMFMNATTSYSVDRYRVTDCADAGVDTSSDDLLFLRNGRVTENAIGVRIGFPPNRFLLSNSVTGNGENFQED